MAGECRPFCGFRALKFRDFRNCATISYAAWRCVFTHASISRSASPLPKP